MVVRAQERPADARPFVPAWLQNDAAEEGFARSVKGMSLYVKKRADSWSSVAEPQRLLRQPVVRRSTFKLERRSIKL